MSDDDILELPEEPKKPETLREKFWRLTESNLFWGGGVGMILVAYGFLLAGALKFSVILIVVGWLVITVSIYRHNFFEGKSRRGQLIRQTLISIIVGIILAVLWLSLRPSPNLDVQSKLVPSPTPPPTPTPQGSDLFLFKDDPLFTPERKARITKDLIEFRAYLARLGFDVPSHRLPIALDTLGHKVTLGPNPRQVGVSADQISVRPEKIDDKTEPTQSYAEYVIEKALQMTITPRMFDPAQSATADFHAREFIGYDFATYFNCSFWNKKNDEAQDWQAAFWEMRERFGKEFTDLLLAYTVKSFLEEPMPRQFAQHRLTGGTSIRDEFFVT